VRITCLTTLILAFAITIAPALQFISNYIFDFAGIGIGYRTLLIDILLVLLTIVVFVKSREKRVLSRFFSMVILWVPWLVYLLYSSNFHGIGAWKLEMHIARVVIPCFAILILYLAWPHKFPRYFFGAIVGTALLLILATYFFDLSEKDFYRNIWLSRLVAIAALYLLTVIIDSRKYRYIPVFLVFIMSMFMIGSRGPFLSFALAGMAYFILRNRKNGMAIFMSIILFVSFSTLFFVFQNLTEGAASFLSHGKAGSISDVKVDRFGVYAPTFGLIETAPVLGLGLGNWSTVFSRVYNVGFEDEYSYPHNIVLEILSELGIVGILLFLLLFLPIKKRLFTLDNRYNIYILMAFLFAMTSSDITQNSAVFLFNLLSIAEFRRKQSVPEKEECMPKIENRRHRLI